MIMWRFLGSILYFYFLLLLHLNSITQGVSIGLSVEHE